MSKPPKSISETILEEAALTSLDDFMLNEVLEEIEIITDPSIKSFVRAVLIKADAFWVAAASNLEGSHPPDEMVEGGMILHTKRVVRGILLLLDTVDLEPLEIDILIAAALLHDITKATWKDEEKSGIIYDPMHAYSLTAFLHWASQDNVDTDASQPNIVEIEPEVLMQILRLIRCSHGMWSTIPETIPFTESEKMLHVADLFAANLHIIVDGADIKEQRWHPVSPKET